MEDIKELEEQLAIAKKKLKDKCQALIDSKKDEINVILGDYTGRYTTQPFTHKIVDDEIQLYYQLNSGNVDWQDRSITYNWTIEFGVNNKALFIKYDGYVSYKLMQKIYDCLTT